MAALPVGIQIDAGVRLRDRYQRTGDLDALQQSILLLEDALARTTPTSLDHLSAMGSLGLSLRARYLTLGDPADLDRSIDLHTEAVAIVPPDSMHAPGMLSNLGSSLRLRYDRDGRRQDLEDAIALYQRAIEAAPPTAPYYPTFLNNLANALSGRYELTSDLDDLDRSVRAHQAASASTPSGHPDHLDFLSNLASALSDRYEATARFEDLSAAIRAADEVVAQAPTGAAGSARYLDALSVVLGRGYAETGQLDYLDRAIEAGEQAVSVSHLRAPERAAYISNLAGARRLRYSRTGSITDIDRSIALYGEAVSLTPEAAPSRSLRLGDLATTLTTRYGSSDDPADASAALQVLAEALVGEVEESPKARSLHGIRASVLWARYRVEGRSRDLDEAISEAERSVSDGPSSHSRTFRVHLLLAMCLAERYVKHRDPNDRTRASALYRYCAVAASQAETNVIAARNWGEFAIEQGDWADAASAYQHGLEGAQRLFQLQVFRVHKEAWLKAFQGMHTNAAYALARIGDDAGAVLAVEHGQAQLLAHVLERDMAELEALKAQGHSDLATRYLAGASRVSGLEQQELESDEQDASGALRQQLVDARARLQSVVSEIQRTPGGEQFLRPADMEDITAAAALAPLVYLLHTSAGGLALVVRSPGEVRPFWLPDLTTHRLAERLGDYMGAYDSNDQVGFKDALDRVARWLWDSCMGPLVDELAEQNRVHLVPTGLLSLLPLEAAWTPDPSVPPRRRYVLDAVTVCLSPNARALRAGQQSASRKDARTIMAIAEPATSGAPPLPFAAVEGRAVSQLFGRRLLLEGASASRERVIRELGHHDVLHIAAHGRANLSDPMASAVYLAQGARLSLRDCLMARLPGVRLAVLSACETALAGAQLPDEVLSLPAGLLQAGVTGVIASLWRVADIATMLLMLRLYRLWRKDGHEPPEALRLAQRWLRDASNDSIMREGGALAAPSPPMGSPQARAFWGEAKPYAHPYFWAAFTFSGS
jgi:CHAT domain-containing protein/tetratricopeptide (TPR) repeat protein